MSSYSGGIIQPDFSRYNRITEKEITQIQGQAAFSLSNGSSILAHWKSKPANLIVNQNATRTKEDAWLTVFEDSPDITGRNGKGLLKSVYGARTSSADSRIKNYMALAYRVTIDDVENWLLYNEDNYDDTSYIPAGMWCKVIDGEYIMYSERCKIECFLWDANDPPAPIFLWRTRMEIWRLV